ncbi:MAG: hypothetical protein QMD02_00200 [Bacteroidales bacterium]|nr:hypothetical protein [Bacteroidales bacterium]
MTYINNKKRGMGFSITHYYLLSTICYILTTHHSLLSTIYSLLTTNASSENTVDRVQAKSFVNFRIWQKTICSLIPIYSLLTTHY